jgi:transcription termination factor Rho
MVLAELRQLADELKIPDAGGLRKGDLIAAIKQRQDGGSGPADQQLSLPGSDGADGADGDADRPTRRERREARASDDGVEGGAAGVTKTETGNRGERTRERGERSSREGGSRDRDGGGNRDGGNRDRDGGGNRDRDGGNRDNRDRDNRDGPGRDDDDERGGGRRGRRFRDRRRGRDRERGPGGGPGNDVEVRDDDVLLPVAGILDVLDNYAFVRTSGYLSGPDDVYVSLAMVRKYGLRRGDALTGAVRQPRDGEQQRQKFNPLVRVDTINGLDLEGAKKRPEFTKLTPLYPNERMRLETEPHQLTARVIDLVMPIGKGQRALIVSPPKAGKTMILQAIANAITTNNPEVHLMVVLVDERPEEVTDMQRSVKGEVIASTFDRPPSDHTTVAELSIERAKRLVEMGHDVVVLLDSITRLGRAYNLAAPASGRILSGGVDSTALYPPKRFLGAARNIEDGGSLTIFATALVETGSTMDTVIFEEFKGTGNAELKLDRKIADKRVFPAVDVDASGTRKEELLLSPDELAVTVKLRRVLSALDDQQALDLLLDRLRKSRTNIEFLMQVAKSTPGVDD